jgi:hypothetical protein
MTRALDRSPATYFPLFFVNGPHGLPAEVMVLKEFIQELPVIGGKLLFCRITEKDCLLLAVVSPVRINANEVKGGIDKQNVHLIRFLDPPPLLSY